MEQTVDEASWSDPAVLRELVSGKFKFTSQQGRVRRQQLLSAAVELLLVRSPEEISFADVCERAGIKRASAYHFFANIQAVFLGLRLLHAQRLVAAIEAQCQLPAGSWRDYYCNIVDVGAEVMREEIAATKLIYGSLVGEAEAQELGRVLDARIVELTLDGLAHHFQLPDWPERTQVGAIAFTVVDAIFRLSYRQHGAIQPAMVEEAKRAALAYLRNYLPEYLPTQARKES
jgi:AcrR family transcriptional regulator